MYVKAICIILSYERKIKATYSDDQDGWTSKCFIPRAEIFDQEFSDIISIDKIN